MPLSFLDRTRSAFYHFPQNRQLTLLADIDDIEENPPFRSHIRKLSQARDKAGHGVKNPNK
jgi:hypothetical protein